MMNRVSSTGQKRPRRSCVVEARKVKREKVDEQIDYYTPLFLEKVFCYFVFMFKILDKIKEDPSNLSFQRKFNEVVSEFYSVFAQWKNLIDIKSVHIVPKKRPNLKTSIVCFNYEKPKDIIGQESMKKLYEEFKNFEVEDVAEEIEIKVFLKKRVDQNLDLIEALGRALKENIIKERLYAFREKKVHPLHIKSFPTVRFSKKINEVKCNTCLNE